MAAVSRGGSGRMYSWWWDSHVSPKNSKWLQENLTDMDSKVKTMIKLIEEDADSFARRAEMYYKKRPELMKMVEEFYRAYRALAERYDHATGVIRQAQRTMVEAFPNQAPFMLGDDSSAGSATGDTPPQDSSTPIRAFFEPYDLANDGQGQPFQNPSDAKRNVTLTEESDSAMTRKDLKQTGGTRLKVDKFAEGRVRKGLKFDEPLENEDHSQILASEKTDFSQEILELKKALAEVKLQKDAGLIQYQQSLVKLSVLETEVSRAQENSRVLSEQAAQAESEIQALKKALVKLEAEKETSLQQYHQYLNQLSDLESNNSSLLEETDQFRQRTTKAETEAQSLREEIGKVVAEKDIALNQYMGSLEMISNLEHKLECCQEDARNLKERAEKGENEVETLKQVTSKLTEEKDAAVLKYEKCMTTISSLEHELSSAQEEAQRLNIEVDNSFASLKNAEERCVQLEKSNQSLHFEVECLMFKMGTQSQELTEKQKELGRLWTCIQEERLRFVEAETAFQTLQHLHAQAQNELRSLASELQNKVQSLRDIETHNKSLQDQFMMVNEENKSLNELNISSSHTIQQLGNEISGLKESKGQLEEEVGLRVDQRNALQQELYCLNEELNVLNEQHSSIMEQVHAVGLSPERLDSSVKEMQDENTSLKETCLREKNEKVALLQKVVILDQLIEKNSMLETSLADLNAELETLREKIEDLEESYKSLSEEKSSLVDEKASLTAELKTTNENLQKISEQNAILENSLSGAHGELRGLTTKSSSLEDSLKFLVNQKAIIASERDSLTSELVSTQVRLVNFENIYTELGEKYSALKDEKEASLCKIEELNISLDVEKKEYAKLEELNKLQLSKMENEMKSLLEELERTKGEYDKEFQNAFECQTEINILRGCVKDFEEKNFDLLAMNHNLSETSESLSGLLKGLEHDHLNQEIEMKAVSQQASTLRMGIFKFFKAVHTDLDRDFFDGCEQDHVSSILSKLGETQTFFHRSKEENLLLSTELSVLVTMLQQLKMEAENVSVQNAFESQTQINILHGCVKDFEEKNYDLLAMNQHVSETSESLSGLLKGLEQDHLNQEIEMKAVSQQASTLRMGIFKFFKAVHTDLDHDFFDGCEQDHVSSILSKLGETQTFFHRSKEENLLLSTELSVLVTMLQQLNMEAENLAVQNAFESQTQINILHGCVKDFEEKNYDLLAMNQSLSETSESLSGLLRGLEQDHLNQEIEMKAVSQQASTLRMGIFKFFKSLHIDLDHDFFYRCEQDYVSSILSKLVETQTFFHRSKEENFLLSAELSVLVTMLQQLKMETENLAVEKNVIDQEFRIRGDQLITLQNENLKLNKTKEEMIAKIIEGGHKEEESRIQMLDLQKTLLDLQRENIQTVEERESLKDELLLLEEEIRNMEEENCDLCMEVHSVDLLSVFLRNSVNEKSKELKAMNEDLHRLNGDNFAVSQRLKLTERMLDDMLVQKGLELQQLREEQEKAKLHAEASHSEKQALVTDIDMWEKQAIKFFDEMQVSDFYQIVYAQKLLEFAEACQRLASEITSKESSINLLNETVGALEEKIRNMEEEKCDLCMEVHSVDLLSVFLRSVVDEKSKELKAMNEDLHRLNGDNFAVSQKLNLTERMLDDTLVQKGLELQQFREEQEKAKLHAEATHSEKQILVKKIDTWEKQALKSFDEMQVSDLYQIVYAQKLWELAEACQRLASENTSKESHINILNETVGALTSQSGNLNTQLDAYGPAITALKQSILSLEKCTSLQVKSEKPLSGELKDAGIGNQLHESSTCSNEDSMVSDAVSDLQDLQRRIQYIETAVVEREHLMRQESSNVHSELETAMKHIAELKSVSSLSGRLPVSEMSEMETGVLTKDIMLDQASESSPYGSSKREHVEVDCEIFESWETADRQCSIDLTTSKANKAVSPMEKQASFPRTRSLKKQKSNRLASDVMIEKELGVDKLEISKRFVEPPQEGQKKRVLERLNSDIQKLANLQITVEDLRRKLKIIEMSKKGKSMEECEILKEQLEEADANIMKLFDQNAKLMKNVDDTPSSTHSKSSMDADESGSVKGRRNSEQARRMSEKIGRIQMEVQKIQFLLLKLDVENDTKGKIKISEARRRVLLKDYLYGGGVRSAYRRKKAAFCSCIRPPTEGD